MNNYIYILTDSNRDCLHVGITDDLGKVTKTYRDLKAFFLNAYSHVSRLVYHEAFTSDTDALRRFNELSRYTRMQKERLIRRHNPNWLDLEARVYQPGAKLSPKVPNFTSDRWNGNA